MLCLYLQQATELQGCTSWCQKTVWDVIGEARLSFLPPHRLWLQEDSSASPAGTHAPLLRGASQYCNKGLVPPQAVAAAEAAAGPPLADVWELGSPVGWGSVPAHHVHLPDGAGMPNSLSAPDLAVVASRRPGPLTGRPSPSRSDDLALGYAGAGCQVRTLTALLAGSREQGARCKGSCTARARCRGSVQQQALRP